MIIKNRKLNLFKLLEQNSFFLFGARATGKTFLINEQLSSSANIIDLLRSDLFLELSSKPHNLEKIIDSKKSEFIVIDEIQKIPLLLDEVHRLIEKRSFKFLLTGSSARKIKHGKSNMLAGRAWLAELFPLSWSEIDDFNLDDYLRYGGLPRVILGQNPEEELQAYISVYLKEEIMAEAIVRKLMMFSRFLTVAGLSNSEIIKYSEIASDTGIPQSTVREYYHILEDTLIGYRLPSWKFSKKRKATQTDKFYFFDNGVANTLAGIKSIDRNSDKYGKSFEQFIGQEIKKYLSYNRTHDELTYWRTAQGQEVDFLIGNHTAIEVKSTSKIVDRDLKGLKALMEEKVFIKYILVSNDEIEKKDGNIDIINWKTFLTRLWSAETFFRT